MHYYTRNPGDQAKRTHHLSIEEVGALVRMEDYCYGNDDLLPLDDVTFFRKIGARSRREKTLAARIREEFFEKTDGGWINHEIEEQIKACAVTSGKCSRAAKARWDKVKENRNPPAKPPKNEGTADGMPSHSTCTADGMPRARGSIPQSHSPSPNNHSGASSAVAADVDPDLLEEPPDPEKEKRAAEVWLDAGSDEARRVVNRALGREERRAFTGAELNALSIFAGQHEGQVCVGQFEALGRYLLAEPRYDCRVQAQMDAVPEGSLLRKRRRTGSAVLEDLPNQMEFAHTWALESAKKEGAEAVNGEPAFRWREFAAAKLGMNITLPWPALLARFKQEINAAWRGLGAEERGEWESGKDAETRRQGDKEK